MKKLFVVLFLGAFAATSALAQNEQVDSLAYETGHAAETEQTTMYSNHSGRFFISLQGGIAFTHSENWTSYRDHDKTGSLFTPSASLAVGYDFNEVWGARLAGTFGKGVSACNYNETVGFIDVYTPYDFTAYDLFLDGIMSLNGLRGVDHRFNARFFAGIGFAHTWNFATDNAQTKTHPQWITTIDGSSNNVFGFRAGAILEYNFSSDFGIFADFSGTFYGDKYNAMSPSRDDPENFLFDVRGLGSLGVIFHF